MFRKAKNTNNYSGRLLTNSTRNSRAAWLPST